MEVINDLLNYKNLKIIQNSEMFSFSLDSILLSNFVTINKNIDQILDIGCGNAPIPLILSTKTDAHITGVEIQEKVYDMAKRTIALNHLEEQIDIINDDINLRYQQIESDQYDIITCNPPYFKVSPNSHFNLSDYKTIARHEVTLNLQQLLKISRKLLKNGGVLAIVHRPERLIDLIEEMRKNNIEPKKLQFVYPRKDQQCNTILIEGVKNGNPGLKILNPLYVHNETDEYTDEIKVQFSD
ncbi:MAG: tRNA1(Val) (adenine(37)-N6)-methyltransferase [Bacilli bacterium]|jgi:tRNA1(Val) A37 N6-methylase TrmN6|nr:tRNA1(Val) (adenine(37)-N6)-methyltransferase [Bacilli bacterium]